MARAQPLHRPRRPHRRDDRRRRAAGRADLGIAAAGRQRAARGDHRHRRSQQAAVGFGGVGGQRSRADRGQVPRVRLGSAARATATTSARFATRSRISRRSPIGPKVFIADTIKGKGVSFMEGLACGDQTYHFHAGAPSLKDYLAAVDELADAGQRPARRARSAAAGARDARRCRSASRRRSPSGSCSPTATSCCRWRATRPEIVVLDADLLSDCGIEAFKEELPDRFIECGIAEQHMVSAAGGMALNGMLPVVHSFACFLSTRANEHIYNNATERRKIIYTATLAGVVPGGPGHSHQSVRDISAIGAVPGLDRDRAVQRARGAARDSLGGRRERRRAPTCGSSTCRSICRTRCRASYALRVGRGVTLRAGRRRRARRLRAAADDQRVARRRRARGAGRQRRRHRPAVAQSHRRRVGARRRSARFPLIVTLDNHYLTFGQGVMVAAALARTGVRADVALARPDRYSRLRQQRRSARASRPRRPSIARAVDSAASDTRPST